MGAATNQESAGFLGAGPIGNRVHAQFTYVTDSRNILDQFEQIGAVGIPAKIPSGVFLPACERVEIAVERSLHP